jgi:hypothetical protein
MIVIVHALVLCGFFYNLHLQFHRDVKKVAYFWQTVVIHTKYSGDEIKKNWIGGACGMYCEDMRSM